MSQIHVLISFVRKNIISDPNYTPYCDDIKCKTMPRTVFNGSQFLCPICGWKSSFEKEFIKKYRTDRDIISGLKNEQPKENEA